jgi:hypothetical protein
MRLHETWTGAANPGDKTFAVGSVEGISFTVRGLYIIHSIDAFDICFVALQRLSEQIVPQSARAEIIFSFQSTVD